MKPLMKAGLRPARFAGVFSLGLAAGAAVGSDLNDAGDFGQLAKSGFALTVNGAFYLDPGKTRFPNLQPNLGDAKNNYAWSMAWFQDSLWVGTNREPFSSDRYAAGGAQVWRYTPSSADAAGDFGLSGTWQRVFVSPAIARIISLASKGIIPQDFPRDAGYRNMSVCNAGDQVPRLYMTATGLPPNILYWNGSTFQSTSSTGLPTTLLNLRSGSADAGFRGLACFKGRLFASPAGTFQDVDISNHPVLLMNANPPNGDGWQTVVDVKGVLADGTPDPAASPLADPNNIGIFQVEAIGSYLWMTTIDRTGGFELWRGDGGDCLEPWVGDGHCNISWAKIIDNGAGRPPDNYGPAIDNAGATLGVYGNDLYIGPSESGFYQATVAELLRVKDAGSPPPGGAAAPHKWQLLVGWPRKDFADPIKPLPGLENLDCTGHLGDMANPGQRPAAWTSGPSFLQRDWLSDSELDDDGDADDCMPASGSGPGLGLNPAYKDPLNPGPSAYFWRMAAHDGDFFVGTLYTAGQSSRIYPGENSGFDLYRTSGGGSWTEVINNGLGNPAAYGVRSLVSTPLGLFLGSANGTSTLPDGGTDVYLGTTAPAGQAAPKAEAGPDQLQFDTGKVGTLGFTLDAGASVDSFGGAGLTASPYEWFAGAVADQCTSLSHADAVSTAAELPLQLASNSPQDVNSYTYTLRVTNKQGKVGCDQVRVTASYDLPPMVDPWYSGANPMRLSVPATYSTSSNRPSGVNLVDFDGDGSESYDVTAICTDPESALARCEFQSIDIPGVTLSTRVDTTTNPTLCNGKAACEISAHLSVPDWTTLPASNSGSALRPDVQVLAEDHRGYQATQRWESLAQPIVDTPDQNDKPVCRNADISMAIGVSQQVTFDPAAVDPPICVDPDGDPLTYTPVGAGPFPAHGNADVGPTAITYTPADPDTAVVDYFMFRATDPGGLSTASTPSRDAMVRVTLAHDNTPPAVEIGFPNAGSAYWSWAFNRGCDTTAGDVCGTASDDLSAVDSVELSLQRTSDGAWWNGSAFVTGAQIWLPATGTASWSYAFSPSFGSYALQARATDAAHNQTTGAVVTFTRRRF